MRTTIKRKKRNKLIAAVILAAAMVISGSWAYADDPLSTARSSVLIEASTRMVLWGDNQYERLPMASTTKIMTALVALENCGYIDETVIVPDEAYGTEGSSMYLDRGEMISLRDLLYGLMLTSGNDAAITIAVHIGGSVQGFADMMNARAALLGAVNTSFVTPNGLHDNEHYTTAFDLALIAAEAMERDDFREIVSSKYYRAVTGNRERLLKNKNKLLWQFDGGMGIKTGYTKAAGKCLVFSAERDGMMLIGVVLASADIFTDADSILTYGFSEYEMKCIVSRGSTVMSLRLKYASKKRLALTVGQDIIVPVECSNSPAFETEVVLDYDGERLPVNEGECLGRIYVYKGGRPIAAAEIVAAESVYRLDILGYFVELARESVR